MKYLPNKEAPEGNVCHLHAGAVIRRSPGSVAENWVKPTRDPELVVCGAINTRSYVLFHNWLLKEDILFTVGGADKICI